MKNILKFIPIFLSFVGFSQSIQISLQNQNIISGQTAIFNATVAGAGTNPSYVWKKNGIVVGTNSNQYSDAGLQTGDVIACVLNITDATISLKVISSNYLKAKVFPVQITPTLIGSGYLGEAISIKSNPTSQVIWKKNGVFLKNAISGNLGNASLIAGGNNFIGTQINSNLYGLLVDNAENIYVIDTESHRVLRFSKNSTIGIVVAGGNGNGSGLNQLNYPTAITLDKNGNLYVCESWGARVTKWEPGAIQGIVVAGGNGEGSGSSQLRNPSGIAVDDFGNLFISDTYNNRIQKWSPGANAGVTVAGGNGLGAGLNQLNSPSSLLINSNGDLYIDDNQNYRILKWTPGANSGVLVAGGNGSGSNLNQWSWHYGMSLAIDNNGYLYIADSGNARVLKWYPGASSGLVIVGGNGWGTNSNQINGVSGIGISQSNTIYVADSGNRRIQKFVAGSTDGVTFFDNSKNLEVSELINANRFEIKSSNEYLISQNQGTIINWSTLSNKGNFQVSSNNTDGTNSTLSYISGFTLSGNDLYISDQNNNRIMKRALGSLTGSVVAGNNGYGSSGNQFANPNGIKLVNGNLFVLNQSANDVRKWKIGETSGTRVAGTKGWGAASDELYYPTDIQVDAQGNTYVLDLNNYRVQKFAPNSKFGVTVAGGNGQGSNLNQWQGGASMTVDASGNVYISRSWPTYDIVKWASGAIEGIKVAGGNGQGSGLNQLGGDCKLARDGSGNLLILDRNNYRVLKWVPGASQGTLVAAGNGYGSASNQISWASGIALNSTGTQIYISDTGNHRVQRWNVGGTDGFTVAGGNGSGNSTNQLNYPRGIYVDASNNLFISDGNNYRIQKWINGMSSGSTIFGGNGDGSSLNQMSYGEGGIFISNGNIYFSDTNNHRILKFQQGDANAISYIGQSSRGSEANQLSYPNSFYVSSNETVYVSDNDNHRIQKWLPGATSGITVAGGNGTGWELNKLPYPQAVTVDSDENVYVYAGWYNRIIKWAKGASVGILIAGDNGSGSNLNQLNSVRDLQLDQYNNIYALDQGNQRLVKFTVENNTGFIPKEPGSYTATIITDWGEFTTNPIVINNVVRSSPQLSISTPSLNVTQGQNVTFTAALSNVIGGTEFVWKKNGIIVGGNNFQYVDSNLQNGDVISCVLYAPDPSNLINIIPSNYLKIKVKPTYVSPTLAGIGYTNYPIKLNSNTSSQVIWKKNGTYVKNAISGNLGTASLIAGGNSYSGSQISNIVGLLSDKSGNLFVIENASQRILRFSANSSIGVVVAGGNGSGSALNQLYNPIAIALDKQGNLYVVEEGNNRVSKWLPGAIEGIIVAGGNGYGTNANQLASPHGIAVDDLGNIFVGDQGNHRVQKWIPGATSGITVAGGNGQGSSLNQLNFPRSLLFNSNGELLIDDGENNRVLKWILGTTSGTIIAGGNGYGGNANQWSWHYGMSLAIDNSDNLFICDSGNNRVMKWMPGSNIGILVAGGNGWGSGINQLQTPFGVAIDNFGNLFVGDGGNRRIQKFVTGSTDGVTFFDNSKNSEVSELINANRFEIKSSNEYLISQNQGTIINWSTINNKGNIQVNSNNTDGTNSTLSYISGFTLSGNDLYISDQNNHRIMKRALGSLTGSVAAGNNGYGSSGNQLASPNGVKLVNGNLFVLNQSANDVRKWKIGETSGTRVAGTKGWGAASDELYYPSDIQVDAQGNTYVLDLNNYRVQKFAPNSKVGVTVAGGNGLGGNLNQWQGGAGMTVDASGNVFISRGWPAYDIVKWTPGAIEGVRVAGGNGQGSGLNQLGSDCKLAIDASGNLFILDRSNYRVLKWVPGASQGTIVAAGNGSGSASNQISWSSGIALNSTGTQVYISDTGNYRVQKWNVGGTDGVTVAGGNGYGNSTIQLSNPRGIFVDASNNLYISDVNNYRIQKYSPSSTSGITIFGGNGQGSALNQIYYGEGGISYLNGYIYFSDSNNHRILKFLPGDANAISYIGQSSRGAEANQLSNPNSFYVSSNETIYVSDIDNHRIQKWLPGATSGITVAGGNGAGSELIKLPYPQAVTVDSDENVYVYTGWYNRIVKWAKGASGGIIIAGDKGSGSNLNQLNNVADLQLDQYNNIYALDQGNQRLVKFTVENNSTYTPTEPGTYTATVSTEWGEYTTADFVVLASPSISVTKTSINCGESSILTISGCNGTIKWNTNETTNSINVSPKIGTLYTCNCTIASGDVLTLSALVNVNSPVIPSISVSSNVTEVIEGGNVFFTASASNTGNSPTYIWKLNDQIVGGNQASFNTSSLKDGDKVACFLKSNASCRTTDEIGSNLIGVKILPSPITASLKGGNCIGSELLVNSNPSSQITWKKDGVVIANPKYGNFVSGEIVYKGAETLDEGQVNPDQIEMDESGNVYILERSENRILRLKKDSNKPELIFGGNGSGSGIDKLNYPSDFVYYNGALYVADANNFRILKIIPGSKQGEVFAGGNGYGNALNQFSPSSLSFDLNGNLFVLDRGNARILKFTSNSEFGIMVKGGNGRGFLNNQLNNPESLNIDEFGDFLILDRDSNGNVILKKWKKEIDEFSIVIGSENLGNQTNQHGGYFTIRIINSFEILINDNYNNRILKYNILTKSYSEILSNNGFGSLLNQVSPRDCIYDFNGDLIVADYKRLMRFTKNNSSGFIMFGNYNWKTSSNQLGTYTSAFTLDQNKNFFRYSGDDYKYSIKYLKNGEVGWTEIAGGNGSGSGLNQLSAVTKIIFFENNLYILDSGNQRILKWALGATQGQIIAGGNGIGNSLNQLNNPNDFILDSYGNLIICDTQNHRVLKWIPGDSQGVLVAGGNGSGVAMNQLYYPRSIAIDKNNNLYIADQSNSRIQKWLSGSNVGITLMERGTALNQTNYPWKVFIRDNYLIVMDGRLKGIDLINNKFFLYGGDSPITSYDNNLNIISNSQLLEMDNEGNIYGIQNSFNRILKYTFENNPKLIANNPGVYSATVKTYWGEYITNSITVGNNSAATFTLKGPDGAVCPGKPAIINSSGCSGTVQWNNSFVGSSQTVYPMVDSEYFATCQQATCQTSKSIELEVVKNNMPITISGNPDTKRKFVASKIYSTQNIPTNQENSYVGFNTIELKPGFIVEKGTTFSANIQAGCSP